MKKTVVILLSDKRSGSTLFQREICKHPDVQTVAASPHTYLETHHWLKAAVMLKLDPNLFSGKKVYAGYGHHRNARTYMEACIAQNIPEFDLSRGDRELVFEGWEALCDRFAQPVFFEKSPQILAHWGCLELMSEWINKTDFDVKVVGLIRNPLSVLYSAQALFHTDPQQRQYGWVEIHENLLRFKSQLSPEQFKLCRYEEITHHPRKAFSDICRFIGIDDYEQMGADVHTSSINKWESDPFFTLKLANPVKETALQLGYSEYELNNPEKPAPPLLKKIIRNLKGEMHRRSAQLRHRFLRPMLIRLKQTYS